MSTNNSLVIETHHLSKIYKDTQALKDLSLTVKQNSIFGFLGPNGAGKSTTIKLLLGLIQPSGGQATIFGHDIQRESVEIRKRVGYLAQDPRYYEHMTARQIVDYTARFFYRGPKDLLEARVQEMLELVGIDDKADRPVRGFSGGERQRLGIAQAQVNYPDLLILDEPAASLDPMGRHDVLDVMERLRKYTTIFYSTHILEDVQRVSDTVAILNRGSLIAEAPINELLAGDGGSTIFSISVKGEQTEAMAQARVRVADQPWVKNLSMAPENGHMSWQISVTDEAAAEDLLLRLILDDRSLKVTHYGRKSYNLEEVFISLVEKENSK
ncbi:MAG: ABC transporter ATP-binding protein [Anaerolineales bacterium]|nr:ABC transporter ATP-binding protein [Anaerolineae bacterium]PWB52675.1 MAG: ABC transporter ATP-binding protein [Anaerolineales bacterium]